jgi:hypothetical protein
MTYTDVHLQLADNVIDEVRSTGFLKPNEPLNAAIARLIVTRHPPRLWPDQDTPQMAMKGD